LVQTDETVRTAEVEISYRKRVMQSLTVFWSDKKALVGLALFVSILITTLAAPLITWFPALKTLVGMPFEPPTLGHLFGTDDLGRDIYSNVIYGGRTSLFVGLSSVIAAVTVGVLIGAFAGYHRGGLGDLLMRMTDMFLVIPRFLLALVIVAMFGQTILNIVLAISITGWPGAARLVRAEFLSIRERPFVEAARAMGLPDRPIIFGEILPNAIPIIIPYSVLEVGTSILIEAGLSFLGVGDPNVPSWGLMLNNAQQYLTTAWWIALFPGLMLSLTVLGLNLLGDALNEYLNPRMRKR